MQPAKLAAVMAAIVTLAGAQGQQVVIDTTVVVVELQPAISTSTVYRTNRVTVLGCPPWERNCPVRHSVAVVTATLALETTVCPLTLSSERLSRFSTTVLSTPEDFSYPPLSRTTTTKAPTETVSSGVTLRGTDSVGSEYIIPASVWNRDFPSGLPSSSSDLGDPGTSASQPAPGSNVSTGPANSASASTVISSLPAGPLNSAPPSTPISEAPLDPASSASAPAPPAPGSEAPATPADPADPAQSVSAPASVSGGAATSNTDLTVPVETTSGSLSAPGGSTTSNMDMLFSLSTFLSFSTTVSQRNNVITVSNGIATESISIGSLTAIIPTNSTSTIAAYVAYPIPANSTSPPNATFSPTGSMTVNATMPWYTSSGSVAASNLFSIFVAVLVAAFIF